MAEEYMCFNATATPSQVTSQPWIYVSSSHRLSHQSSDIESIDDTEMSTTIGKWLLFHDTVPKPGEISSAHDRAWEFIKPLVVDSKNTGIISAKCSTAWEKGYVSQSSPKGLICCYTADYRDKQDVKRAGDAIRKAYVYSCNMFYKTDHDTYAGKYRHLGDKTVSMYKHSMENKLYERDTIPKSTKWVLTNV